MPPKYLAFFVFLFVVGTVLGLLMEDSIVGIDQQSTLSGLLIFQQVTTEENWGFANIVGAVPTYFSAVFNVLFWNFSFLEEPGLVYIKWFVWAPLMAMMVWALIMTFVGIFQRVLS